MEWIDVNDRLPEEDTYCLTLEQYPHGLARPYLRVFSSYTCRGSKRCNGWGISGKAKVLFWIPVPKFPSKNIECLFLKE